MLGFDTIRSASHGKLRADIGLSGVDPRGGLNDPPGVLALQTLSSGAKGSKWLPYN